VGVHQVKEVARMAVDMGYRDGGIRG